MSPNRLHKVAIVALAALILLIQCRQLPASNRTNDVKKVWLEKDGIAVIEVENASSLPDSSQNWKIMRDPKGFTGSGYVVWNGAGDWGPESRPYDTSLLQDRKLTFHVKISTRGTYFLKVRNYHLLQDGDNDTWTSVNNSHWGKTYDHQVASFTFDERGDWAKYPLDTGIVKVELAGRSRGFGADRLVLFLDTIEESVWSDVDMPESEVE